jgi:dihydrofolate reductase
MHTGLANIYKDLGALFLDETTYKAMLKVWPNSPNEDDPVTSSINNLPKFVSSNSLDKVNWGKWDNAFLINDNLLGEIEKLKKQKGKNIGILSSADLVQKLIDKNIINAFLLLVYPVILGNGKSLFKEQTERLNLKLTNSKTYENGVLELVYSNEKADTIPLSV